ncbi:MAG: SpaA isopeptide-forming pilin-related protein [Clostridia bacterium]|nr:SpaA isopeptide-forming pilin-related protein [Clostridia bacterium]
MGVYDEYDAFLATKQSIYCILYGTDPTTYYRGGDARGENIKNAIVRLVNIGRYGTQTPSNASVTANKVGNLKKEGDYYFQEYSVNSPVETSEYEITSISGFPSGSKVTNMSNVEKTVFYGHEHFKIRIPQSQLTQNLNGVIAVQAKCKTYPVFFGERTIANTQNYLLTFDPFGDVGTVTNLNLNVEGQLNLKKVAEDNNIWTGTYKGDPVPNATYVIKNGNGQKVKDVTTDSQGNINVTLPVGNYTIEENLSPNYYIKDNNIYSFSIAYHGDSVLINIGENVVKGGYFSTNKISEKNNIWTGHKAGDSLSGATYGLYNDSNALLDTKTSTSDGTLWANYKLQTGRYYILELDCPKWFEKDNEKHWFEIKNNEQRIDLTMQDYVVEGGYFSASKNASLNNVWTGHKVGDPVCGATYGIYTLDGKIVEIDGEKAISTSNELGVIFNKYKLKLGEYYMQEIEAAPFFQKDETKHYFTIRDNEESILLPVENRAIEGGYVNIFKTAAGNNLWTGQLEGEGVANATYRIESLSVEGWYIDVTTNNEGKIIEKNYTSDNIELLLGKYKIFEISSPDGWKINNEERYFEIDKNEENIIIDVSNMPEIAGKVKVHKTAKDTNYWLNINQSEPIENAQYTIFDLDGNKIITLTTNKFGDTETALLGENSYYIKETYCPDKWKLNEEEVYFTINKNEQEVSFEFTDEPEEAGFLNINKTALEDNYWTNGKKGEALEGVKYELRDKNNNVLLELITDKNGQFSEDIMLNKGTFYLWEIEAPEHYIVNENPEIIEIKENGQKVTIDITNKVEIGGFFDFTKISSDNNAYTGDKKGTYLANAIYRLENDITGELIADLKTNENGTINEKILLKEGKYRIYEKQKPNEFYLLNPKIYYFEITKNGQAVHFDFEDEPIKTELDIEKIGLIQAQPCDEIRYDFNTVANNSNVEIDNFTVTDKLPYEYISITKLFTGVYNGEVSINVLYKTNLSENYILYKENLNSKTNTYIDFENIKLQDGEFISNFKLEFGTVPANFKAEVTPFLFAKVNSHVKGDDVWTNNVDLTGTFLDITLQDKDEWTTISYKKELNIKKLPRTGM